MARSRAGWLAPALAACSIAAGCGDAPVLRPEIETPDPGSSAYPYDEIDTLILSVGPEGGEPEVVRSFARGETPVLDGVPFGEGQVVRLSGRSGTAEVAYGRTCAFDITPDAIPDTPHLYFSRTLQWAAGAEPLTRDRVGGGAFTTTGGNGIFAGGDAGGIVERFDPMTGRFTPLAAAVAPRLAARLVPFVGGRALHLGGVDEAGDAVAFFEVISPDAAAVRQVVKVDGGPHLVDHAAAQLGDGRVVAIGGRSQTVPGDPFVTAGGAWIFAFDDAGGTVPPPAEVDQLQVPRWGHALTRLGDGPGAGVLVTGGIDAAGAAVEQAELFEPLRGSFAPDTEFSAGMITPRRGHVAVRIADDSVLIIGGVDAAGAPVPAVERYVQGGFRSTPFSLDPVTDGFVDMIVIPLRDGSTLIAGGRNAAGEPVSRASIVRLDPLNGSADLVPTASMAAARAGHAAALLCDGTVLLVGGTADPAAPASERYNPLAAGR